MFLKPEPGWDCRFSLVFPAQKHGAYRKYKTKFSPSVGYFNFSDQDNFSMNLKKYKYASNNASSVASRFDVF